jgi:cyclophilin family peptidyl-prolyl cis-trans isomerase
MFDSAPHLNGKYTIVGEVVSGLETVKNIKKGNSAANGSVNNPDYILKAELITTN